MVVRGAKIPVKMLPLIDRLKREDEVWLNNLGKSEWNMLYDLKEQGIITYERGAKVKKASGGAVNFNKKHRRLFMLNCFVFGMLLASNYWLGSMWLLLTLS